MLPSLNILSIEDMERADNDKNWIFQFGCQPATHGASNDLPTARSADAVAIIPARQ